MKAFHFEVILAIGIGRCGRLPGFRRAFAEHASGRAIAVAFCGPFLGSVASGYIRAAIPSLL
jgi:hypothetical protein